MRLTASTGAPYLLYRLDDLLFDLLDRLRGLLGRRINLVDRRQDALAGAVARLGSSSDNREAVLENMRFQFLTLMHVELLPDFVRERDRQLAVADVRFRHG